MSVFVVALTLMLYTLDMQIGPSLLYAIFFEYLTSYFDGSQFTSSGRYWSWFAQLRSRLTRVVPAKLHFEEALSSEKQYLFGSHPHGPMSWHHGSMLTGSSTPAFHDVIPGTKRRHLAASIVFRIPIFREILLWLGCVDAARSVANQVLKDGKSLVILVGGIQEQMISERGHHHVYIKSRKGNT